MNHYIILKTLCGCERIVAVPGPYPHTFRVPIDIRQRAYTMDDAREVTTVAYGVRVFERTLYEGQYGFPVYQEVPDAR